MVEGAGLPYSKVLEVFGDGFSALPINYRNPVLWWIIEALYLREKGR